MTLFCLAALMSLVLLCTFAQTTLGSHEAVQTFMRSWVVWIPTPAGRLPLLPGGASIGLVLLANLAAAQFSRLEFSKAKGGLWLAHAGLALFLIGEFATARWQVDSEMALREGQTLDFTEDTRRYELAIVDSSDPAFDDEWAVPGARLVPGHEIKIRSLPFTLRVHAYHANAAPSPEGSIRPLPPVSDNEARNSPAASVELVDGAGRTLGRRGLFPTRPPDRFELAGRKWSLALRPKRYRLPFSLTLNDFRHDVYLGTEIPKNFSSLVRIKDPGLGEDREALIAMNAPLRHRGLAIYQASFGEDDRLSILQVVRNPSWQLPYLACAVMGAGLLWHFVRKLLASTAVRRA